MFEFFNVFQCIEINGHWVILQITFSALFIKLLKKKRRRKISSPLGIYKKYSKNIISIKFVNINILCMFIKKIFIRASQRVSLGGSVHIFIVRVFKKTLIFIYRKIDKKNLEIKHKNYFKTKT